MVGPRHRAAALKGSGRPTIDCSVRRPCARDTRDAPKVALGAGDRAVATAIERIAASRKRVELDDRDRAVCWVDRQAARLVVELAGDMLLPRAVIARPHERGAAYLLRHVQCLPLVVDRDARRLREVEELRDAAPVAVCAHDRAA